MTPPLTLPLVGKVNFSEVSKEKLLEFWENTVKTHALKIRFNERMTEIKRVAGGFEVVTSTGTYRSATVLLAIGRRGTPRKLGVEGEDLPKVVYRLLEPEQYRHKHVLVVGGGDSAVEAGLALAELPDITVTLSYRGDAFGRIKTKNRKRLEQATAERSLSVMLSSQVKHLGETDAVLSTPTGDSVIKNHAAIVCAGGELPTKLLVSLGVTVATHYGETEAAPKTRATSSRPRPRPALPKK
ncbi:MAG: NAD(P)-binding domain-containing protein [Betaproteobacteria bacterium]|nr:NAD(P)-binding domain-containing protein [Betaproteobacteria bacterium]